MNRSFRFFLLLGLCALTLISPRASWAATTGLRIIVITPENKPVSGIVFRIQVAGGQEQTITTDADGNALLTPIEGRSAMIRGAADTHGAALQMDANDAGGGLRIPLLEQGTQTISFYLDSGFLYAIPGDSSPPPTPTPAAETVSNVQPADGTLPTSRPLVASAQTAVAGPAVTATAIAQRIQSEEGAAATPTMARDTPSPRVATPSIVAPLPTQVPMSTPATDTTSRQGLYLLGGTICIICVLTVLIIIGRRRRVA